MTPTCQTEALPPLIEALCRSLPPMPGHARLLDAIRNEAGIEFVPRLTRGGWYRPGRILDADGNCVAEEAHAWVENAWIEAGEDFGAFADTHADAGLIVTRLLGSTHYFVCPTGKGPSEFLQLEIEELQEVQSHALIGAHEAESAEALLDPPDAGPAPVPLGAPRYHLRRVTDIADFVGRLESQPGKPAPVLRFLREWAAGSAGQQRRLCDHWVLALSEHLDRYKQVRYGASPVAAHAPQWATADAARGTALAQHLHEFDRTAGYGFAWYFHMVSGRRVPRSLPPAVFSDLQDGLAYLPDRDAALVRGWMESPYAL